MKVSAIVPAYNEAKNILRVLSVLRQVPAIEEIIVVSDGSTDETARLVREAGSAKVVELALNLGKTRAVLRGAAEAQHPALLLCDADLLNLNARHMSDLVAKYCEGYDMVIQDKGSQPWIFREVLQSVPALSGTRILDREHLARVPFRPTDRFQLETRINDYFLEQGLVIAVVPAAEVRDARKYVKYPFWQGLFLDIKGFLEVALSDGPASLIRNLATFRKIRRLEGTGIRPRDR